MFNIGAAEMLLIALVLLIAVGPEQLPSVIRRTGKVMGQMRSMGEGLRRDFMSSMEEIERAADVKSWAEAEINEVRSPAATLGVDDRVSSGLSPADNGSDDGVTEPADDDPDGNADDTADGGADDDPADRDEARAAGDEDDSEDLGTDPTGGDTVQEDHVKPIRNQIALSNAFLPKTKATDGDERRDPAASTEDDVEGETA